MTPTVYQKIMRGRGNQRPQIGYVVTHQLDGSLSFHEAGMRTPRTSPAYDALDTALIHAGWKNTDGTPQVAYTLRHSVVHRDGLAQELRLEARRLPQHTTRPPRFSA